MNSLKDPRTFVLYCLENTGRDLSARRIWEEWKEICGDLGRTSSGGLRQIRVALQEMEKEGVLRGTEYIVHGDKGTFARRHYRWVPPEDRPSPKKDPNHGEYTCRECGEVNPRVTFGEEIRNRMISEQLCFICDLWTQRHHRATTDPNSFIIDGTLYGDGGVRDPGQAMFGRLGFGGRWFKIKTHDGRVVETNNLWCAGDIPPHFRDRYPDNATMDPPMEWAPATPGDSMQILTRKEDPHG